MEQINNFINKLSVLYVEDDDRTRKSVTKLLTKRFKNVKTCINGEHGFNEFSKGKYDIIISDISMPIMDGIELLAKIRENGDSIPFMFTTAKLDPHQLVKVINLHVDSYILKPLDLELLDEKINKLCEDLYYKTAYVNQKKELDEYINILSKEAVVSKTDINGQITFVNDFLCDISGYSKNELIGEDHSIIRHPDLPKCLHESMWNDLRNGLIWEGVVKNKAKDGSPFYLKTKIIPIFDEFGQDIVEYISIRFLVTKLENQKRELHKRIIERVSNYKFTITDLTNSNKLLKEEIIKQNTNLVFLSDLNKSNKDKITQLLAQLMAYENNLLELSKIDLMMKKDKNKQFDNMYDALGKIKIVNNKLSAQMADVQKTNENNIKLINEVKEKSSEKDKRIEDLLDLVSNLQKEVEDKKNKPES